MGLKKDILNSVAEYMERNEKTPLYTHEYIREPIPNTFNGTPKPSKKDLLVERLTRMTKPVQRIELGS